MLWLIPVDTHAKRIDTCPPADRRSTNPSPANAPIPPIVIPTGARSAEWRDPVMAPLTHEKVPPLRPANEVPDWRIACGNCGKSPTTWRRGSMPPGRACVLPPRRSPNIGITSGNCGNPRRPVRRGAAKANEMASLLDFPGRACAMVAAEGPDILDTSGNCGNSRRRRSMPTRSACAMPPGEVPDWRSTIGNCGKSSTTSPAEIAENADIGFRRPVTPLRCRRSSRLPPAWGKALPACRSALGLACCRGHAPLLESFRGYGEGALS
jgi:hypothetical protein